MKKLILLVLMTTVLIVTLAPGPGEVNLRARLSGDQEVPSVDTTARGQATLFFNPGSSGPLNFRVNVSNIQDVSVAHLHCGASGENGPVVAILYEGPTVSPNGILAQGAISGGALLTVCVDDFLNLSGLLLANQTYVDVHTLDNLAGEMRGQVLFR